MLAEWLSVRNQANSNRIIYCVSSQTSKSERARVRKCLVVQACHPKSRRSIIATKGFESSITLHINGLINAGMTVDLGRNGHQRIYLCTPAPNKQREGRARRLCTSLSKSLQPSGVELLPSQEYEWHKHEALPLILATVCLEKSFPIIGIAETTRIQDYTDPDALALIKKLPLEATLSHPWETKCASNVTTSAAVFLQRSALVSTSLRMAALPQHTSKLRLIAFSYVTSRLRADSIPTRLPWLATLAFSVHRQHMLPTQSTHRTLVTLAVQIPRSRLAPWITH